MAKRSGGPLSGFHPAIVRWFNDRFEAPSAPQVRGWPAIQLGKDTLTARSRPAQDSYIKKMSLSGM